MVEIRFDKKFNNIFSKIKDNLFREKVIKQIKKISENPKIGKPMKNVRKGTREVRVKHYRLSYSYIEKEKKIIILSLYHKDVQ